jgi:hypothetical protein
MKQLLLIFASSSDSEKLLEEIHSPLLSDNTDIYVFYDHYIPVSEFKESNGHKWFIQLGEEKVEQVMNAFLKGFIKDYPYILFWEWSDSNLSIKEVNAAFEMLRECDAVLAANGDYDIALLGMTHLIPGIFENNFETEEIRTALKRKGTRFYEFPAIKTPVVKVRH